MTKFIETKDLNQLINKIWDYKYNNGNLSLKEIDSLAQKCYVLNPKMTGFCKLSNYLYKLSKDEKIERVLDEFWFIKEIMKYNGLSRDSIVTLEDLNNYLPYYEACCEIGVF